LREKNFGERVRAARKQLKLSQEKFAEPIGIKGNSLSEIESGKKAMSLAVKKLMISHYSLSEDWVDFGIGDTFKNNAIAENQTTYEKNLLDEKERRLLYAFNKLDEARKDRIIFSVEDAVLAFQEQKKSGHPENGFQDLILRRNSTD